MPRLRHWKLKVLIQFVLAHLPGGERLNYSLQRANGDHSPERIAGRIPELVEILNFISQSRKLDGLAIAEIGNRQRRNGGAKFERLARNGGGEAARDHTVLSQ